MLNESDRHILNYVIIQSYADELYVLILYRVAIAKFGTLLTYYELLLKLISVLPIVKH